MELEGEEPVLTHTSYPTVKIVCWNASYDGEQRRVEREVSHIESIENFILEKIKDIQFSKVGVLVSFGSEQIRIPEEEFEKLQPEVQQALRSESEPPHSDGYAPDGRWVTENYWSNCNAYIFPFNSHTIQIGLHWGYDGLESADESYEFIAFEHPFIGEFISCMEKRWGEAGEVENIVKYYQSSPTTANQKVSK